MAKNKTTETEFSVMEYLKAISDAKKRDDVTEIVQIFQKQTGLEPKMWGTGIVGFGSYHYKYESGHEGDAPLAALASRANNIVLYLSASAEEREILLKQLGKHKMGKACIYIQKLADIDTKILGKLVINSVKNIKMKYA